MTSPRAPRPQKPAASLRRPGPPGGVRDRNRREKSAAIREAALLLFLERGIEGVSVDDIMSAAAMAKGSFYRYFDDQSALVSALLEPTRRLITDALEACGAQLEHASTKQAQVEAYRKVGDVLATLLMEHPGAVRLYLQESRAPAVGARRPVIELSRLVSRYAISLTEKAQQHGILRPIPVAVSALTVVGAAERLLHAVLLEEDVGNPLAVPAALTSLILDGLRG